MSISTVTARCATIQEEIAGIEKAFAFDETPNSLKTAALPCMTNFPSSATYAGGGTHMSEETRVYQMMLWLAPVSRPVDAARHTEEIEGFINLIRYAFLDRPALGGLQYVRSAKLAGDGGPVVQAYAGVDYLSIVFNLEVTELCEVNYADGD